MVLTPPRLDPEVIWHDLECGGYRADLPLWRELAEDSAPERAAVLDIGAGSGRVALDLAQAGHRVTALDRSPALLLAALRERAEGLPVVTAQADARDFSLPGSEPFDLCLVPMQTIQLLRGAGERRRLLAGAKAHLRSGALIACALVCQVDEFDSRGGAAGPSPELTRIDGTTYLSRAVRVAVQGKFIRIDRERLITPADSPPPAPQQDVIELELVGEEQLWQEGLSAGLRPEPTRLIAETREHSGSQVVVLRV